MLEVAANTDLLCEDIHRCLGWACGVVTKGNLVVDPIADCDCTAPSGGSVAKEIKGARAELVDLTVAAWKEKLEDLGGKVLKR
jgi:hypothetical protein